MTQRSAVPPIVDQLLPENAPPMLVGRMMQILRNLRDPDAYESVDIFNKHVEFILDAQNTERVPRPLYRLTRLFQIERGLETAKASVCSLDYPLMLIFFQMWI
jgi:hypothetical protein